MLKMRRSFICYLLTITMTSSLAIRPAMAGDSADNDKDKKEDAGQESVAARNIKKSKNELTFQIQNADGETIDASFENDPSERMSITQMRQYLTETEIEAKNRAEFIRRFIMHNLKHDGNFVKDFMGAMDIDGLQTEKDALPQGFKRESVKRTINWEAHPIIRQLANDYFAIEYFNRLPQYLRDEANRQYIVKMTPIWNAKGIIGSVIADAVLNISRAEKNYNQIHDRALYSVKKVYAKLKGETLPPFSESYKPAFKGKNPVGQTKDAIKNTLMYDALGHPMNMGLHGFPAQSVMFSFIIGAMMWQQLTTRYHENPMGMVQHLESLKDPVAHLSFYTFMVANRFTTNVYTKYYTGLPTTGVMGASARGMKFAMPYVGMTAGMIVSNLTAEVAGIVKACSSRILSSNKSESALDKKPVKKAEVDPCDKAQEDFFNFDNKVEQYIPMILSLTLSTGAASFVQKNAGLAYQAVKNTGAIQKVATSKMMENVSKAGKAVKFKGLQWFGRFIPGSGWVINYLTVQAVVVNALQTAGFLWLDHTFSPWLNQKWAQIWRASRVNNVDVDLKRSFLINQKTGWTLGVNKEKCTETYSLTTPEEMVGAASTEVTYTDEKCVGDMRVVLKNLQNQMDMWRMQNHSKFFTGVQSWSQMMNQYVQELSVTESYYKFYAEEVFRAQKFKVKSDKGEALDGLEAPYATYIPFLKSPLYGVEPVGHNDTLDPDDYYLEHPQDMQTYQMKNINAVGGVLSALFNKDTMERRKDKKFTPKAEMDKLETAVWGVGREITDEAFTILSQIAADFKSEDIKVATKAILKLNQAAQTMQFGRDPEAMGLFKFIRESLGNPTPMLTEGMAIPFAYYDRHKDKFKGLDKGGLFGRYTEYMTYQMFCGPRGETLTTEIAAKDIPADTLENRSVQDKSGVTTHSKFFGVKFHPPTLLSVNPMSIQVEWPKSGNNAGYERSHLCASNIPFSKLYYSKVIDPQTGDRVPFLYYLNTHIRPDVLGNYADTSVESKSNVDAWWDKIIVNPVRSMFSRMDDEYQKLLVDLVHGFQQDDMYWDEDTKTYIAYDKPGKQQACGRGVGACKTQNTKPYKATDASRSLLYSNLQEANAYLTVLADIENSVSMNPQAKILIKQDQSSLLDELNQMPAAKSASQVAFIRPFTNLISYLQATEIGTVGNKLKVILPQNMGTIKEIQEGTQKAISDMKTEYGNLKLNQYQAQVAELAFEALEKTIGNLNGYLLNIQLTNFSAMTSYDTYLKSNQNNSTSATNGTTGSTHLRRSQ